MSLPSISRHILLLLSFFLIVIDLEYTTRINAQRANSYKNQWNNPMQQQQQQLQKQELEQQRFQSRNKNTKWVNNNNNNQISQNKKKYMYNEQKRNKQINNAEKYRHRCRIWVPSEALQKYSYIKTEGDPNNAVVQLEICCPGFTTMYYRGQIICRPVCENCVNGHCQAPNKCLCYEEFVQNDNGDCVFACPLDCLNGQCYLDGTCECETGYKLDETRKFCRPICSTGCGQNPRHNCSAPELCTCSKGYQLMDEGCQPMCQPECGLGGTCIEPNVCNCEVGFVLKNGVCHAECYQKCDNGICYSRNRCICNPGFMYHERSTMCIPK